MHSATTKAALAAAVVIATAPAFAQAQQAQQAQQTPPARSGPAPIVSSAPAGRPCSTVTVDPPTYLTLGKSRVVRLDFPATRIVVGGSPGSRAGRPVNLTPTPGQPGQAAPQGMPGAGSAGASTDGVADTEITLLGPNELFFLGRKPGAMNVVLQGADGRCVVKDIVVTIDPEALQGQLAALMPEESGVRVRGADNSLVLTGTVSDAVKLDQILTVAAAYGDSKKLVNLLRVTSPQQVMLEVQIAEVSKTLLDKLGASVNARRTASSGLNTYSLISSFLSGGGGLLQALRIGTGSITIDAQKDDGLVRVLAEPNIMAISGQSASFLSGGKIFIPVAQSPNNSFGSGGTTITLEEKEFGVGLKFTPTVLDGRINLKVVSEVSELSQTGTPFSTINGVTAILPSLSTRRIDTTVQLGDGQSFVVAGLIKNNVTEALKRVPGLGDVPVMGALFRSTEFQTDQTELMFVVTPRLVKPLTAAVMLPTDNHAVPNRGDVMFMGRTEGATPLARPAGAANEAAPAPTVTVVAPPSAPPVQAQVEPPANLAPTASTSAVNTSVVEAAPLLPVSGRQ